MTKRMIVAATVIFVAVAIGILIAVASTRGVHNFGPAHSGQGRVIEVEWEPAKTKCVQKNLAGKCTKYKITKAAQYEVDYIDSNTGEEREAHVSQQMYNTCAIGKFFNGRGCI